MNDNANVQEIATSVLGVSVKWDTLLEVAESSDIIHCWWLDELNFSLPSWLPTKLKSNPVLLLYKEHNEKWPFKLNSLRHTLLLHPETKS